MKNVDRKESVIKLLSSLTGLVVLVSMLISLFSIYLIRPETFDIGRLFPDPPVRASNTEALAVDDEEKIENGIHLATGLVFDDRFDLVRSSCTSCHSAKLITQNRMSRDNWEKTIRWMQETQKLWDLGPNESFILDYLAEHYAPVSFGRRKNLEITEWYVLD